MLMKLQKEKIDRYWVKQQLNTMEGLPCCFHPPVIMGWGNYQTHEKKKYITMFTRDIMAQIFTRDSNIRNHAWLQSLLFITHVTPCLMDASSRTPYITLPQQLWWIISLGLWSPQPRERLTHNILHCYHTTLDPSSSMKATILSHKSTRSTTWREKNAYNDHPNSTPTMVDDDKDDDDDPSLVDVVVVMVVDSVDTTTTTTTPINGLW